MTSYCLREKKHTENVPGSEKIVTTKNGRKMLKSICVKCGAKKSKFVKMDQKGGDIGAAFLEGIAKSMYKAGKMAIKSNKAKQITSKYIKNMAGKMIDSKVDDVLDQLGSGYHHDGGAVDIHSLIGKLPRPKGGWTPPGYKYMGPYNPLDQQLTYDKDTGEVLDWKVKPKNKLDEISAHHDICYDMGKNKGLCDKKMVKDIDQIPWKEKPWGTTVVRNIINTKQKLGLGYEQKKCKKGKNCTCK